MSSSSDWQRNSTGIVTERACAAHRSSPGSRALRPNTAARMRSSRAASGSPWVVPIETPHQPNGPAAHCGLGLEVVEERPPLGDVDLGPLDHRRRGPRARSGCATASRSPRRSAASVRAAASGSVMRSPCSGRVEGDDADAEVRDQLDGQREDVVDALVLEAAVADADGRVRAGRRRPAASGCRGRPPRRRCRSKRRSTTRPSMTSSTISIGPSGRRRSAPAGRERPGRAARPCSRSRSAAGPSSDTPSAWRPRTWPAGRVPPSGCGKSVENMNSSAPACSIIQPTGSPGNGVNLRCSCTYSDGLRLQLASSGSSVRRNARWAKSSWCIHDTTQLAPSSMTPPRRSGNRSNSPSRMSVPEEQRTASGRWRGSPSSGCSRRRRGGRSPAGRCCGTPGRAAGRRRRRGARTGTPLTRRAATRTGRGRDGSATGRRRRSTARGPRRSRASIASLQQRRRPGRGRRAARTRPASSRGSSSQKSATARLCAALPA